MLARGVVATVLSGALLLGGPVQAKGDRELGQHLSSQCTSCHQLTGRSAGGVPPIVAWPEDQFLAVMLSYKDQTRENEVMRTIARRLSLEEIEALATFFGGLPNQPAIR